MTNLRQQILGLPDFSEERRKGVLFYLRSCVKGPAKKLSPSSRLKESLFPDAWYLVKMLRVSVSMIPPLNNRHYSPVAISKLAGWCSLFSDDCVLCDRVLSVVWVSHACTYSDEAHFMNVVLVNVGHSDFLCGGEV